jgi:hypothetical protein
MRLSNGKGMKLCCLGADSRGVIQKKKEDGGAKAGGGDQEGCGDDGGGGAWIWKNGK